MPNNRLWTTLVIIFTLLLPPSVYATNQSPVKRSEISAAWGTGRWLKFDRADGLTQYRFAYTWFPASWQRYKNLSIGLDASFVRLLSKNNQARNHSLTVIALAPVLRIHMPKIQSVTPFAEISVGPAWLSKTRFDDRNLGMRGAFSDSLGLGVTFKKQTLTLRVMHYSNAGIDKDNRGVTVPVVLYYGYQF